MQRKYFLSLEKANADQVSLLEQLFDRMCIRRKGTQTSGENWHRDVSAQSLPGDDIFGGWINLDVDRSQYFSCVPGTHVDRDASQTTGFAKISEDVGVGKEVIEIPPGHWIIFINNW